MAVIRGPHFSMKRLFSNKAGNPKSVHAHRMSCIHCDLSEILERSRPPDSELVDLIEQAFLEGQIDGVRADLAYSSLLVVSRTKAGTFAGTSNDREV